MVKSEFDRVIDMLDTKVASLKERGELAKSQNDILLECVITNNLSVVLQIELAVMEMRKEARKL